MLARDWFESVRSDVVELARMELKAELLRARTGPKAQGAGSGGRGASDASAPVLRLVQAEGEVERMRARVEPRVERGLAVLYGESGRGGLAKLKGSATADCICGYYLMGYSWREVAEEMVRPESGDARQWCKRRAYRGLDFIDEVGTWTLENS